jgi:uncharacterized protein
MKDIRCALITGASSGLGEEYARQLAARCHNMVLVARRGDRLLSLAQQLTKQHGIHIRCFEVDLSNTEQRNELAKKLIEDDINPDLLINNAGLGDYGSFVNCTWEKHQSMLRVNVEALTHLIHLFLPKMIVEKNGAIINVSSIASLLPMPDFGVYAASKAYVTSFSEALRIELKEFGVKVLAVCPGPVKTEFGQVAGHKSNGEVSKMKEFFYVPKEQVVSESIIAMDRNQARLYPGWKIAAAAMAITALPIFAIRMIMASQPRR